MARAEGETPEPGDDGSWETGSHGSGVKGSEAGCGLSSFFTGFGVN